LHPAASRVRMLAEQTPSSFVAFDMLADGDEDIRQQPLTQRRARLLQRIRSDERCFVTPQTDDPKVAASWFERFEGAGLDGVVAKRAGGPYVEGERVMMKIKHLRTADCVVGGYRLQKDGKTLGSLLLGLYNDEGVLHHVGHTSAFNAAQRREVLALLKPLEGGVSFTGEYGPGGPSRWNQGRDMAWVSVSPELVCEVAFDHMQGGHRFRHASRFLRWRPDKKPSECTFDQLEPPHPFSLGDVVRMGTTPLPPSL
jgi:ATP-dependent DNA ligase